MERDLAIERVYNLGDYKSIRFSDSIHNLPEKLALNQDLVDKVRYLQLLNVELHYRQYIQLAKKINTFSQEQVVEAMQFLEEEKATTMKEIETIIFSRE